MYESNTTFRCSDFMQVRLSSDSDLDLVTMTLNDLETEKWRVLVIFRCIAHSESELSPKLLEIDQDNLRMKSN